ncbi:hypothetical protein [Haloarchaeobius sp. TZWSO28]|uniref:hypothetical protein n=1 Tax=Haloarchaeobius sp. TZWSO28 TaxID=3446119 RepID=UPI003EB71D93
MAFPLGTSSPLLEALRDVFRDVFEHQYDDVVVYADRESEVVLHEGSVRMRGDGWLELPTGRLISPDAVHHIDVRSA